MPRYTSRRSDHLAQDYGCKVQHLRVAYFARQPRDPPETSDEEQLEIDHRHDHLTLFGKPSFLLWLLLTNSGEKVNGNVAVDAIHVLAIFDPNGCSVQIWR
jgi:hypothetical protein